MSSGVHIHNLGKVSAGARRVEHGPLPDCGPGAPSNKSASKFIRKVLSAAASAMAVVPLFPLHVCVIFAGSAHLL
jgi:hypothetical protein